MSTKIADAITPALLEYWWGGEVKETIEKAILRIIGFILITQVHKWWDRINRS